MTGLDVVISFDCTGSMYPALAEVRRKVSSFITALFDQTDDLRIGIITHGDYCDGAKLITAYPLTDDLNALVSFVQSAPQTNGGDSDEAYEYVLKYAREEYTWRSEANKVLIMIADADPHAVGYYYGGKRYNLDWLDEAKQLVANGINIYPVQALNHSRSNTFYNGLAKLSNTPKLDLHQFSNIIPILTAIVYKQQGNEQVEQYAEQLEAQGLFNRNIAGVIDTLLGRVSVYKPDVVTTRYTGDTASLREVDPARFQMLHVDHTTDIKGFVVSTGATFKVGRGFYELTKSELVQERKEVVLRDRKTGDMWSGKAARDMIGLPYGERGTVRPKYGFDYDVFIQSTSANRKLIGGTRFLYEAK